MCLSMIRREGMGFLWRRCWNIRKAKGEWADKIDERLDLERKDNIPSSHDGMCDRHRNATLFIVTKAINSLKTIQVA